MCIDTYVIVFILMNNQIICSFFIIYVILLKSLVAAMYIYHDYECQYKNLPS